MVALESAAGAGGSLEMKALSREFARASNLLDAGDLVGANLLLEHIKKDAGLKKEGGAKLWVDVVKAGALLQFLAGDIAGFDDALRIAKAGLVGDTVELVWELEQERGERLTEYGEMRQDVAMIERGANVLSTGAAPLLDDVPRVQQLRTMATLCRAKSSPFFERTLTSDNPEAWLAEFKKVLTLCSLAAKLADLTPEAPSSLRAHANVHNAFVLAWLYAVGVGDQNRVDAIMRLEQALSLIKGNGNEREIASIYIGAGDVYGVLNLLQKKRNFTVKEIDLYTSAVAVVNKSADPSVWASAHQRIGSTYFLSYKNGYRRDDLLFSKRHFEDAASVFTRDFSELAWARTLANLAAVRGYLGITDRSRTVVAASVLDLKTAEEALIGSSSQGVRTEAMRNRRILETWLMGNGRG